MSRYRLSSGVFISKSVIDNKIRKAKELKLAEHYERYGYYFCTTCGKNNCVPIDCAHVISVSDCQKMGKSELAYDLNNIVVEGRFCHRLRDRNCLNYNKK